MKVVDFQMMDVGSPLKDLAYFLFGSATPEALDHLDELLNFYHEALLEMLINLNCDVSPYSKDNFELQLQKDCSMEFFHCVTALKYCTFDIDENTDLSNMTATIMRGENNSLFMNRLWKIVCIFLEKNWLLN